MASDDNKLNRQNSLTNAQASKINRDTAELAAHSLDVAKKTTQISHISIYVRLTFFQILKFIRADCSLVRPCDYASHNCTAILHIRAEIICIRAHAENLLHQCCDLANGALVAGSCTIWYRREQRARLLEDLRNMWWNASYETEKR